MSHEGHLLQMGLQAQGLHYCFVLLFCVFCCVSCDFSWILSVLAWTQDWHEAWCKKKKKGQSASEPGSWQHFPKLFFLAYCLGLPNLRDQGQLHFLHSSIAMALGAAFCPLCGSTTLYSLCILKNKLKDSSVYKAYITQYPFATLQ